MAWPGVMSPGPRGGRPRYSPSRPRRSLLEPAGLQPEDQQDVQERLCARVGQAQPGDAGAVVVEDGVAGRAQDAVPRSPAGSVTLLDDREGRFAFRAISMSSSKLANPEYSSHLEKSQQPEKDPGQQEGKRVGVMASYGGRLSKRSVAGPMAVCVACDGRGHEREREEAKHNRSHDPADVPGPRRIRSARALWLLLPRLLLPRLLLSDPQLYVWG